VVYGVTARLLMEQGAEVGHQLPHARTQTRAGQWLTLHASRVSGTSGLARIAVIIEPADPLEVAPLLFGAYGLTARESDVARLVLRGVATAGIASTLSISDATVQQHLKSVFDKTGVSSRRELVGQVFARSYRRTARANSKEACNRPSA